MLCAVIIMFKLHYASLDLGDNDIPCFEFQSKYEMLDFVSKLYENNWLTYLKKVCLISISDHLIVVNSMSRILKFINDELNHIDFGTDVFLQEYASYEDAFKVALDMKEENPLCYS